MACSILARSSGFWTNDSARAMKEAPSMASTNNRRGCGNCLRKCFRNTCKFLMLNSPGCTPRLGQQAIGSVVGDKDLFCRIPLQRVARPKADVQQVCQRGSAVADFLIGAWPLARVNALEPVS